MEEATFVISCGSPPIVRLCARINDLSGSFSYVGRMYLEQLRGLFKSVYLTRAHLRHDDLVWKIPIVSVERGPIQSRTMILMRSDGLVYDIR